MQAVSPGFSLVTILGKLQKEISGNKLKLPAAAVGPRAVTDTHHLPHSQPPILLSPHPQLLLGGMT